MLKKLVLLALILLCCGIAGLGATYYWFVVLHPGDQITIENIKKFSARRVMSITMTASPNWEFFRQRPSPVCRFRSDAAGLRQCDGSLGGYQVFSHIGFDAVGIIRAALKNLQARKVVQGGSSLTQQTAKNLFKRTDRSCRRNSRNCCMRCGSNTTIRRRRFSSFMPTSSLSAAMVMAWGWRPATISIKCRKS